MSDDAPKQSPSTSDSQSNGERSPDELLNEVQQASRQLHDQVSKIVVGQEEVIEQVFISLFTRGHALLVGVPGLAKTLLVSTIARSLSLAFSRVQFTPDLMPSDITGTEVIEEDRTTGKRHLRFVKGPVFANVILADEINRTPPKTQAALLEAMQEHHVTAGGMRHALPQPFFVLATQNPIEQEGTYPLPEAQLDRFMFMIRVGYPDEQQELDIVKRTTSRHHVDVEPVLDAAKVLQIQELVRDVPVADHVVRYALRLARATRLPEPGQADDRPEFMRQYLSWGAGPRASQYLVLGGKARAILDGRTHVTMDDIRHVAAPVLRHRLIANFAAEADGVTTDNLIERLLEAMPAEGANDPQAEAVMR
ncbi:AAA family ATPase [Phycisphaerales bacterium AB-hyl4]|uniref:AAA family ATPase n=1 Tax=Natronomicrosphaera hydrolytica TaxID=3242702 RepID=A0ABV4U4D5_9BACT